MKILVLGSAAPNTSPGSRFRIEQWMPIMARQGAVFDYAAFDDATMSHLLYTRGNHLAKAAGMMRGFARRIQQLRTLRRYDAVFIYEEGSRMGPALVERFIAHTGVPLILDFCDPIYLHQSSPRNGIFSYLKCVGKTATACRLASHVIVGNTDLRAYVRRHNPRVTIVPITIDTDEYRPRSWPPDDVKAVPLIGWTGSHSTVVHLDSLRPILTRLAKLRRFRLRVIGTETWPSEGIDVRARPWRAATEVADLSEIDIGIMPLPDERWTRLRTNLKIRQYMGLGIPTVASPVGVNTELIEDGRNGFLASSDDEWIDRLTRLIDDPTMRRQIGGEGRRTIEERYAASLWAPRVLDIVRSVVEQRTAGQPGRSHRPATTGANS